MKEMAYQKTSTREVLVDDYYKDYHYVILSMGTHPCGYVEVPQGNKLHGLNIDRLPDIKCHGGVTYARNYLNLDDRNTTYRGWWIGWDYAHYNDYYCCPSYSSMKELNEYYRKKWATSEIVSECKNVIEQLIQYKIGD